MWHRMTLDDACKKHQLFSQFPHRSRKKLQLFLVISVFTATDLGLLCYGWKYFYGNRNEKAINLVQDLKLKKK